MSHYIRRVEVTYYDGEGNTKLLICDEGDVNITSYQTSINEDTGEVLLDLWLKNVSIFK